MAVVLIVIFIVGAIFFKKKDTRPIYNQPASPPVNHPVKPIVKPLSEEEKLKIMALNFIGAYGTYKLGDFFNIEILKDKMTDRLWEEKSQWIEIKKEESKNQPKRYITFSAHSGKADIVSLDSNEAEIMVDYTQTETKGAVVQGEVTIKYVNEFGEEKPAPPPTETSKKMYLKLVKVNNEWRVDKVEDLK